MDPRRPNPMLPDPSSGNISVGGPGGIQIQGGMVHMSGGGGYPQHPPGSSASPAGLTASGVPSLVKQNPKLAAALTGFAGLMMLVAPAVLISAFALPFVFFVVPALLATGLFVASGALLSHSRKYLSLGGLDPMTERRLLDVGVQYRGRVTVTAAARALDMSLAEADAALTALARTGHVTVENDPRTGIIVYVFPEIEAGLLNPGGPEAGARRLP